MVPTQEKDVFTGCKIAICGTFGENYPKDKIKRFITNYGGTFVPNTKTEKISHLICSIKAFKARTFDVRDALETQDDKYPVRIVKIDWLIDCMGTKRRRSTKKYDPSKEVEERRLTKQQRKLARKAAVGQNMANFQRIVQEASALYNLEGHHLYYDPTGFGYDIVLARSNVLMNSSERVFIKLFESHEPPHAYAAFSTYISPVGKEAREVLAPVGSEFTFAFQAVKTKFKEYTHHEWSDRGNATNDILDDGTRDHSAFVYHQPELGPLGMDLPPGRAQITALDEGVEGNNEVTIIEPWSENHIDNSQASPKTHFTADEEARRGLDLGSQTSALDDIANYHAQTPFRAFGSQPVNAAAAERAPAVPNVNSPYPAHAVNAFREFADQYRPATFSSAAQPMNAHDFAFGSDPTSDDLTDAKPGIVTWNWGGRVGYSQGMH